MNEQEKQVAVERYLKELEDELGEVPASRRRELLEDVRSHIEEAWAERPVSGDCTGADECRPLPG